MLENYKLTIMKELSIEEKAKAYDRALEIANAAYKDEDRHLKATLERIFPELKESEDEKIRKWCISHFRECFRVTKDNVEYKEYLNNKVIPWLEKQSEQKPADKVEPKFKVGDWVFIEEVKGYKNGPFQIKAVDSFGYSFDEYHIIPFMYEDLLSKWTIKDAKEGDVLMSRSPFIYGKQCPYGGLNWYNNNFIKASSFIFTDSPVHPAAKEQRDLLFQKMHEAGYEWDAEKKELKKIDVRENLTLDGDLMEADCSLVEKKLAWSEEDDYMLESIVSDFAAAHKSSIGQDKWLKSLKQRIGG